MIRRILPMLAVCCCLSIAASGADIRREIQFPDIPGYVTLPSDLHMHTVFSDGNVWPTVRVDEAWRQGIDAISITDHIEYQPHKDDVRTNHNRPFDIANGQARARNVLLIRGTEITRETPPGHFNALFLEDANPLDTEDFLEVFQRANKQSAFVFWNHQAWKGEDKGSWLEVHTTLYANKWFHGMEVCNGDSYFPTAHQWCLEKNLTMIGSSDIHQPDLRQESAPDDHRTMTLVFAKERTLEAIKEALHSGRTAVWYKEQIIGPAEWLAPLFQAGVEIAAPHVRAKNYVVVEMRNHCDVDVQMVRQGSGGPDEIALPARSTSLVRINTAQPNEPMKLNYSVGNFLVAPDAGLPVELEIAAP